MVVVHAEQNKEGYFSAPTQQWPEMTAPSKHDKKSKPAKTHCFLKPSPCFSSRSLFILSLHFPPLPHINSKHLNTHYVRDIKRKNPPINPHLHFSPFPTCHINQWLCGLLIPCERWLSFLLLQRVSFFFSSIWHQAVCHIWWSCAETALIAVCVILQEGSHSMCNNDQLFSCCTHYRWLAAAMVLKIA